MFPARVREIARLTSVIEFGIRHPIGRVAPGTLPRGRVDAHRLPLEGAALTGHPGALPRIIAMAGKFDKEFLHFHAD
jgi:hypothetical protein